MREHSKPATRWLHVAGTLLALALLLSAVLLGVALSFSVQLINDSALSEFSAAVRSVNGQPDFELRAQRGGFDEALYARVANDPRVSIASPVIELETNAWAGNVLTNCCRPSASNWCAPAPSTRKPRT